MIATKKNLAYRLRERNETIEYRRIRTALNGVAQSKHAKQEYRVMHLEPETIIMLQNEGITIAKINEFGTDKYLLTWALTTEQKLAEKIMWVVDFEEKHISVPHNELSEAENNAIVKKLRSLGFYIQSAIA